MRWEHSFKCHNLHSTSTRRAFHYSRVCVVVIISLVSALDEILTCFPTLLFAFPRRLLFLLFHSCRSMPSTRFTNELFFLLRLSLAPTPNSPTIIKHTTHDVYETFMFSFHVEHAGTEEKALLIILLYLMCCSNSARRKKIKNCGKTLKIIRASCFVWLSGNFNIFIIRTVRANEKMFSMRWIHLGIDWN